MWLETTSDSLSFRFHSRLSFKSFKNLAPSAPIIFYLVLYTINDFRLAIWSLRALVPSDVFDKHEFCRCEELAFVWRFLRQVLSWCNIPRHVCSFVSSQQFLFLEEDGDDIWARIYLPQNYSNLRSPRFPQFPLSSCIFLGPYPTLPFHSFLQNPSFTSELLLLCKAQKTDFSNLAVILLATWNYANSVGSRP